MAFTGVEIAGRFKSIIAIKWDTMLDSKKRLKVVYLKKSRKDERKFKRGLAKIYGGASANFPFGVQTRLYTEYRDAKGNMNTIKKLAKLRGHRRIFRQTGQRVIRGYFKFGW